VQRTFRHLHAVDAVLSTWRPDSDVIRWRQGHLDIADAHPWLAEVRTLCTEASVATAGLIFARCPAHGVLFCPHPTTPPSALATVPNVITDNDFHGHLDPVA
jgi:hypothetical protein